MCWGIRYFGCLGLRDVKDRRIQALLRKPCWISARVVSTGGGWKKTHRLQDNSIGKKRLRDRLSASIMKWWRRERRGRSR